MFSLPSVLSSSILLFLYLPLLYPAFLAFSISSLLAQHTLYSCFPFFILLLSVSSIPSVLFSPILLFLFSFFSIFPLYPVVLCFLSVYLSVSLSFCLSSLSPLCYSLPLSLLYHSHPLSLSCALSFLCIPFCSTLFHLIPLKLISPPLFSFCPSFHSNLSLSPSPFASVPVLLSPSLSLCPSLPLRSGR